MMFIRALAWFFLANHMLVDGVVDDIVCMFRTLAMDLQTVRDG
jgi:hypothetical protein